MDASCSFRFQKIIVRTTSPKFTTQRNTTATWKKQTQEKERRKCVAVVGSVSGILLLLLLSLEKRWSVRRQTTHNTKTRAVRYLPRIQWRWGLHGRRCSPRPAQGTNSTQRPRSTLFRHCFHSLPWHNLLRMVNQQAKPSFTIISPGRT